MEIMHRSRASMLGTESVPLFSQLRRSGAVDFKILAIDATIYELSRMWFLERF